MPPSARLLTRAASPGLRGQDRRWLLGLAAWFLAFLIIAWVLILTAAA